MGANFNAVFLTQASTGVTYYCSDGGVYAADLIFTGLGCTQVL